MRIARIELREIGMPLLRPFDAAHGRTEERRIILVRLLDGEGGEGWGECVAGEHPYYTEEWTGSAWEALTRYLIPLLLGRQLRAAAEADGALATVRGQPMAKAALETACWELEARRRGEPLWHILGGTKREIPCGVAIGLQPTDSALVAAVEREVASGYQRVKVKIKPGADVDLLRRLRSRFPALPLMADANSAYALSDQAALQALDAFDLMMIEQPLGPDQMLEHAQLQKGMRTAICLDESIRSAGTARLAVELGACRVINLKSGRVGGYASALSIERLCRQASIPLWCGGMLEAGVGRAHNVALATLSGFNLPGDLSASARYWAEDIIDPPVTVSSAGTITPSDRPGIGVEVRLPLIERLTVRRQAFDA